MKKNIMKAVNNENTLIMVWVVGMTCLIAVGVVVGLTTR